jgi:hypothetical protein
MTGAGAESLIQIDFTKPVVFMDETRELVRSRRYNRSEPALEAETSGTSRAVTPGTGTGRPTTVVVIRELGEDGLAGAG